jgi:hypothetical protein
MGSVTVKDFIYYYQNCSTDGRGMKCEHEAQVESLYFKFVVS